MRYINEEVNKTKWTDLCVYQTILVKEKSVWTGKYFAEGIMNKDFGLISNKKYTLQVQDIAEI